MFLGIDLGTSGIKAILVDSHQSIIASGYSPLTVQRPQPNWSEQAPSDWLKAAEHAIHQVKSHAPEAFKQLEAISLSGQMHGATLVDKRGVPIRPAILWNDTRADTEAKELDRQPIFRQISGNIVFPGFTAPKLMWLKKNEADHFARIAKILLPKDYLRFWLSGDYATDLSDASGTAWLDVQARQWSDELLTASGMTQSQMPQLIEGNQQSGLLKTELAAQWGIDQPVVIGGGGGDNAASAVGMGILNENEAFVSLGTSGVLFASSKCYKPNPESAVHTFCHAVENTWHQMGVILSAADALNWYAKTLEKTPAELTSNLGDMPESPSSVLFLPYLSGERTPHNSATAQGAFFGITHRTSQNHMTQAVLEGVAFALKDNQLALEAAGSELSKVLAIGGGSNSTYWLKILANVLNIPVAVPAEGDYGAAFGAARLAMLATGKYATEAVCTPPKIADVIYPTPALAQQYQAAHQRYQHLYQALKPLYQTR